MTNRILSSMAGLSDVLERSTRMPSKRFTGS
jgi:hypothetical protein